MPGIRVQIRVSCWCVRGVGWGGQSLHCDKTQAAPNKPGPFVHAASPTTTRRRSSLSALLATTLQLPTAQGILTPPL